MSKENQKRRQDESSTRQYYCQVGTTIVSGSSPEQLRRRLEAYHAGEAWWDIN